jgi:hypothetical protein
MVPQAALARASAVHQGQAGIGGEQHETFEEAFLAHVLMPDNRTVYEHTAIAPACGQIGRIFGFSRLSGMKQPSTQGCEIARNRAHFLGIAAK